MKTDLYTKGVLTIIAICLTLNIIKDFELISKSYAEKNESIKDINSNLLPNKSYGLIPVNADGTIDVNIKNSTEMDVNIKEVDGFAFSFCTVPVRITK